jgi:hypothetical protein
MEKPENLAVDDSRKMSQHEQVKDELREAIHQKIRKAAHESAPADEARVKSMAEGLKEKTIREVGETEAELQKSRKVFGIWQVVDYLFYLAYGLIGIEIILEMLGARQSSGFKQFMDTVSAPVLAPFKGLLFDPGVGPFQLMLSYIFALFFYFLLHLAVKRLMRLFTKSVE